MAKILITSGDTKVHIDEVRHIGNMSSGRFGADLAREALLQGHEVIFMCAKGSVRPDRILLDLSDPDFVKKSLKMLTDKIDLADLCRTNLLVDEYADFDDYAMKLEKWCTSEDAHPEIILLAAAVSDYGMPTVGGKISSDQDSITFTMTKNPKLITKVKEWAPNATLVGFKLLVGATSKDFDAAVQKQMDAAGSDFVVANDLHSIRNGVHRIYIYKRNDNHPTPLEFGWGGMNLSQCVVRIVTGKWKPGKIWRQIRGDESLELALGKDGGNS